jgi:hypothetical protein
VIKKRTWKYHIVLYKQSKFEVHVTFRHIITHHHIHVELNLLPNHINTQIPFPEFSLYHITITIMNNYYSQAAAGVRYCIGYIPQEVVVVVVTVCCR